LIRTATGVESVGDERFDMGNGFHVDYGSQRRLGAIAGRRREALPL